MSNDQTSATRVAILMPVFNDWQSLRELLPRIDQALEQGRLDGEILVVDDGSTEPPPADLLQNTLRRIQKVDVLELTCNLGHQRAIAVGLTQLAQGPDDRILIVMDGDGEDMPEDMTGLVRKLQSQPNTDVVFAERLRRSESLVFRLGYAAYRWMHWLLTGIPVRFGNFSAIKTAAARHLVFASALWNHYAAAVVHSRLRYDMIPTARGQRFAGRSNLNLVQLMAHGFGALSVFSERVCGRLFALATTLVVLTGAAVALMLAAGTLSPALAVVLGSLALLVVLTLLLSIIALIALRSFPSFIPARDAPTFIKSVRTLSIMRADS